VKVHYDLNHFSSINPAVTIGTFDGFHKGHRLIINRLNEVAKSIGGESVVLTFWPHPRVVLNKDAENLRLLNTMDEKIQILEKSGLSHLVIYPFTKEFAALKSCDFVKSYLVNKMNLKYLIFGHDHQFGNNREGNFESLQDCANQYNFNIEKIEALNENDTNISSTYIRNLIQSGEIQKANKLLGYLYFISGCVVEGEKIGRKIGFPTANIKVEQYYKLIPQEGVYAVKIKHHNKIYNGMLNIGVNPTINDKNRKTIEVNIFDFNESIYGHELQIYFIKKIRNEIKFQSVDKLANQIIADKQLIENIFLSSHEDYKII
jgi:riboflavin kinase/FMN adenylyltransferase